MNACLRRYGCAVLLLLGLGCASAPLRAADCTISTTGINFSNAYDPTSGASVTGNGAVAVNCTATTWGDALFGFTVTTSLSQGSSGSYTSRAMVKGSEKLYYNLYTDPVLTTVFGDGTAGTSNYSICYPGWFGGGCGNNGSSGQPYTLPVYGQLPGGQDVSAGTYSDSLIARITF